MVISGYGNEVVVLFGLGRTGNYLFSCNASE